MGSLFLCLPLVVAMLPIVRGGGGVVGSCTMIFIGNTSVYGGRDGVRTIEGGWRYHTGMERTMLKRVRVEATWNAWTPGGG
jgi:hypothetical protein